MEVAKLQWQQPPKCLDLSELKSVNWLNPSTSGSIGCQSPSVCVHSCGRDSEHSSGQTEWQHSG